MNIQNCNQTAQVQEHPALASCACSAGRPCVSCGAVAVVSNEDGEYCKACMQLHLVEKMFVNLTAMQRPKSISENPEWLVGRGMFMRQYRAQNGLCAICGLPFEPEQMTRDHIVPRSKGGGTQWDNIQLACAPCNEKKGDAIRQPNAEFRNAASGAPGLDGGVQ